MPNILINPNSGIIEFTTGTAGGSTFNTNFTGGAFVNRMSYDNFGSLNLTSYVSNITGLDRFTVDGANGRLFSVTDNLSGSLFSVNDIAGLPIIEAFDDNTVIMGAFNRNDFVLSGNSLGLGGVPNTGTTKLFVNGNTTLQGNLTTSGSGIFTSGLDLNNSKLINATPDLLNVSASFNITGTQNSRLILANSPTIITGSIVSGNPIGFNASIIQISSGQVLITGIGSNVIVSSYNNQFRTAAQYATISILHTGNNGYIMYGNTST
jgi:hypothetical protein